MLCLKLKLLMITMLDFHSCDVKKNYKKRMIFFSFMALKMFISTNKRDVIDDQRSCEKKLKKEN